MFVLVVERSFRAALHRITLQVLRELVKAGADLSAVDDKGRNALHLSVNSSSDDADEALDLEAALLRGGCPTSALDVRGRLPLHYAFVKAGKHRDCARADPIEVVSLLVEAMEERRERGGIKVDLEDEFGARPIHYAAYRGATVSCLLLLQKGKSTKYYYYSDVQYILQYVQCFAYYV